MTLEVVGSNPGEVRFKKKNMEGGISGSGFGIKPILINIIFTGEVIGSNPGWVNFFLFFFFFFCF